MGMGTAAARLAPRWQCAVSCQALLTAAAADAWPVAPKLPVRVLLLYYLWRPGSTAAQETCPGGQRLSLCNGARALQVFVWMTTQGAAQM